MSWSNAPHVVITQSNILSFIMSRIIPRTPVDNNAPTNERNFVHRLSPCILLKISTPYERFLDSKPPEADMALMIELTRVDSSEWSLTMSFRMRSTLLSFLLRPLMHRNNVMRLYILLQKMYL